MKHGCEYCNPNYGVNFDLTIMRIPRLVAPCFPQKWKVLCKIQEGHKMSHTCDLFPTVGIAK